MRVVPLSFRRSRACAALLLLATAGLGGCQTTETGTPGAQAAATAASAAPAPMTHEKAATECWMGTEKTSGKISLDKRADIVSKCIDQKMGRAAPPKT